MSKEPLDDEPHRIRDDVLEHAREFNEIHDTEWRFEWEIPAEVGGWVYIGESAIAKQANFVDQWPEPNEAIGVHYSSTHPHDENRDRIEVYHVHDMESKIDSKQMLKTIEGEKYRTPLWVKKRMFWEGVEYAINWMEDHSLE